MEILTKRPAGMSYADYKMHLKKQGAWLKERVSRGFLVYKRAGRQLNPLSKTGKVDWQLENSVRLLEVLNN